MPPIMRAIRGFWTGGGCPPEGAIVIQRKQERRIHELIVRGGHVSLIAPRQSGKTTLLTALRREHERERPVLYISMERFVGKPDAYYATNKGGFQEDFRDYLRALLGKQSFRSALDFRWRLRSSRHYELSDTLLALPLRTLLLIDEYSGVSVRTRNFLASLRAVLQDPRQGDLRLGLVLADLSHRSHYDTGATSPFNIAENIALMDFDPGETQDLVLSGFEMNQLGCDPALATRIYAWTRGDPYLTQKLCIRIVEQCWEEGRAAITETDIETVARRIIQDGDEVRWSTLGVYLQGRISDDALKLLRNLLQGASEPFYREMTGTGELAEYGLIVPSDWERGGAVCIVRNRMTEEFLRRFLKL